MKFYKNSNWINPALNIYTFVRWDKLLKQNRSKRKKGSFFITFTVKSDIRFSLTITFA